VRVYAVVSELSDEALELFLDRQMPELVVENRDPDEPDHARELHVEPVEIETLIGSARQAGESTAAPAGRSPGESRLSPAPFYGAQLGHAYRYAPPPFRKRSRLTLPRSWVTRASQ
jgi:hypothetical protein